VLAREGGRPVLVRDGRILVATFHPELTADTTVHEYFLKLAAEGPSFVVPELGRAASESGRIAPDSGASKFASSQSSTARPSPMPRR